MPPRAAKKVSAKTFDLRATPRSPASSMGPRAVRTRALIIESARPVFLKKGYAGVRIEDIADAAGLSRGSFYSYFPAKRDLLLELGRQSAAAMDAALDAMEGLVACWDDASSGRLVRIYLDFLDADGAFLLVWNQATFDDAALARVGMRTRLVTARRFGEVLLAVSGLSLVPRPPTFASSGSVLPGEMRRRTRRRMADTARDPDDDPARFGLAVLVMMDRYWSYWRVNSFPFSEDQVVATLADVCDSLIDAFRRKHLRKVRS